MSAATDYAPAAPTGERNGARTAPVQRSARPARAAAPRTSRVVLRRVEPWSVLKLSILFYISACLIVLTAGVLLWAAATSAGLITNVEGFMDGVGFEDFRFEAGQILRGFVLGGLVLTVAGSLANGLMAVLYNLVSDVVGGLKLTLAEDVSRRRT